MKQKKNIKILIRFTNVRWLSKGKMLARIFELRSSIHEFLIKSGRCDVANHFIDEKILQILAYLVGIMLKINNLKLMLQGIKSSIIDFYDALSSFTNKLNIWISADENSKYSFSRH